MRRPAFVFRETTNTRYLIDENKGKTLNTLRLTITPPPPPPKGLDYTYLVLGQGVGPRAGRKNNMVRASDERRRISQGDSRWDKTPFLFDVPTHTLV